MNRMKEKVTMIHYRSIVSLLLLALLLAACGGAPGAALPSAAATGASAATSAATSAAPIPTVAPAPTEAPASTAATSASATTAGYPLTIENCGRTLTFDRAPERIVVTYESLAELLVALGLGEKIVGVQYGKVQEPLPEQAEQMNRLPYLAEPGKGSASKEVLISTRPDFVLVTYFAYDLDPSTSAASEADYTAAGAQAYGMATDAPCLPSGEQLGMETIYADIRNLGAIFGVPDRAASLIEQMQGRIAAVQQRVAGRAPVNAIYYEDGTGPFTIYGGQGLATELLTLAGGRNVLEDQGSYTQVGPDVLAATDAEFWVITEYPGFDPVEQRADFLFTTFPNLPASQQKRSIGINGAEAGVGIRLPSVVETLAEAFHPDAFADASSATAASYPLTIENCGRTVTIEQAPQRIVATFQSVAEALVALGAGEQIVGLYFGQVQDLPAGMEAAFAEIPTLGSGAFPSREVVLDSKPDLVVAYNLESNFGGEYANVRAALEQAGVPIFGIDCESAPVDTAARYLQRLRELGTVLGREAQAQTIAADMQTRIAAVQRVVQEREPVRGVFYYGGEGPFTVYGSGIANELIEAAGGLNLFKTEASQFPQLGAEAITGANPDVLVWSDFGPLGAQYLPADPLQFLFTTFSSTTAATNQRGGAVPGAGMYPGVRMAEAVEALAKLLHPEVLE